MSVFELKQKLIYESTFIEEFTVSFDRVAGWFCNMVILFDNGSKTFKSHGETEQQAVKMILDDYLKFIETD